MVAKSSRFELNLGLQLINIGTKSDNIQLIGGFNVQIICPFLQKNLVLEAEY
jgi:hypothetical protein